jgi:hypothetical protein
VGRKKCQKQAKNALPRGIIGCTWGQPSEVSKKVPGTVLGGFCPIEPSGEEFAITVPEGVYSPQEW